ncbi:MAG: GNAT family N-acetyltransferase, partial [Bacteroidetes bacterium]|nr:GNAT family N-acetyltransferase [Bacteroidota bacterium]
MINTERLILLPSDLHMLESIVNQNWEQLSAQIDGYAVENNGWYEDFQVFIWMRDLAQDGALETNWWNYLILHKADRKLIGTCGFKGAPGPDGVVEIGYEIAEIY